MYFFSFISNAVQHKNPLLRDKVLVTEKEYETYSKVLKELIALLGNEYSGEWALVIYGLKCLGLIIILASFKEDL